MGQLRGGAAREDARPPVRVRPVGSEMEGERPRELPVLRPNHHVTDPIGHDCRGGKCPAEPIRLVRAITRTGKDYATGHGVARWRWGVDMLVGLGLGGKTWRYQPGWPVLR